MRRGTLVVALLVAVLLAGCTTGIGGAGSNPPETTTFGSETPAANGTLTAYVLNVGQGASTLVVGPDGTTMLVDTGDWRDDGEFVIQWLQTLGIDRINHLVTTHPDADHIGGHAAVIEYLETQGEGVGAIWDPGITSTSRTYEQYLDAVESHNVTLYETRAGDEFSLGQLPVSVLAPPEGYLDGGDSNENSLVLHLEHGRSSVLLPGDGERDSEAYLLEEYGDRLNSTVLLLGHHGSDSSSTGTFLDTVSPRIGIVSSGYDFQYGHPHEPVLDRLADRGIRTYWTATHGTIRLRSNGTAITVATQESAPTAPRSLREGSPIEPGSEDRLEIRRILRTDGSTGAPAVTDGGTATDASLTIATIHADAQGDDRDNLTDEYLIFETTADTTRDLAGWTVADEAGHRYVVPDGVTLAPGETITLRTGSGTESDTDLYWGSDSPIWNNGGDTVVVRNADGHTVLEQEYDG